MSNKNAPAAVPQILVVEDSDTMWFLYNELLGEEYMLHRVINGRDALYKLVQDKPQLIILDWTLDEIRPWDEEAGTAQGANASTNAKGEKKSVSGLEVLRVIKRSPFKNTPIIMLTGHKGFHEKMIGKIFGADKYLTKPLNPDALVQAVYACVPPFASRRKEWRWDEKEKAV